MMMMMMMMMMMITIVLNERVVQLYIVMLCEQVLYFVSDLLQAYLCLIKCVYIGLH